jgi:hypothetical protein
MLTFYSFEQNIAEESVAYVTGMHQNDVGGGGSLLLTSLPDFPVFQVINRELSMFPA